eukprot:scaffold1669_cov129-Cylindrotheca_fusiformis.AAC.68
MLSKVEVMLAWSCFLQLKQWYRGMGTSPTVLALRKFLGCDGTAGVGIKSTRFQHCQPMVIQWLAPPPPQPARKVEAEQH